MSIPNTTYLTPAVGSASASPTLLTPHASFGRPPGAQEPTSPLGHLVPLKCRTPHRGASPLAGVQYISALDHLSTKLRIPLTAVERTLALEDDGLVPGICRLYLEGRCRQGERCYQVHANPMVVEQLRQEALSAPSCCAMHGADCNYEGFPLGLTVTIDAPRDRPAASASAGKSSAKPDEHSLAPAQNGGDESEQASRAVVISLHSLFPTNYLWGLYSASGEMHLRVPRNKICREHRKGLCRFGSACSFLHVCRQISLDRDRGTSSADPSRNPSFHAPPLGKLTSRSQGHMSLSDHFGGTGSQFAHGNSIPTHSFVDQPSSFSRPGSKPLLSPTPTNLAGGRSAEPLLRPAAQPATPPLAGRRQASFSHNPYAEASSLQ